MPGVPEGYKEYEPQTARLPQMDSTNLKNLSLKDIEKGFRSVQIASKWVNVTDEISESYRGQPAAYDIWQFKRNIKMTVEMIDDWNLKAKEFSSTLSSNSLPCSDIPAMIEEKVLKLLELISRMETAGKEDYYIRAAATILKESWYGYIREYASIEFNDKMPIREFYSMMKKMPETFEKWHEEVVELHKVLNKLPAVLRRSERIRKQPGRYPTN